MLQEFKKHIKQNFYFLEKSKLLIAVSGGIDSMVLTHLAHQLSLNFSICHCNFQLRGQESDDDQEFVKKLGKELKKEVYTTLFDTEKYSKKNKLSIQVAARNLRYQWFYELIEKHQYDYVLTAHNTNDDLETFLINLIRGVGLEGFTGIPPINNKSVRPLLRFSRDKIKLFAIKNGIPWREDCSNANIKYVRNKIRHKVLPILQEVNPSILESFQKTLQYLKESQGIINDKVKEISKDILTIENDVIKFDALKLDDLQNKKAYLYQILSPYGFTEWNDVVDLIVAKSGKQLFSKTHRLIKDRNQLILAEINPITLENKTFLIQADNTEIRNPIYLIFQKTGLENYVDNQSIVVDKNLLKYPLSLRKWSYGDYLCPMGMKGSKKLSQLFKDRKLSLIEKEKIWLLTDADNNIVWVIGTRQDRRFSANKSTKNCIKISYKP